MPKQACCRMRQPPSRGSSSYKPLVQIVFAGPNFIPFQNCCHCLNAEADEACSCASSISAVYERLHIHFFSCRPVCRGASEEADHFFSGKKPRSVAGSQAAQPFTLGEVYRLPMALFWQPAVFEKNKLLAQISALRMLLRTSLAIVCLRVVQSPSSSRTLQPRRNAVHDAALCAVFQFNAAVTEVDYRGLQLPVDSVPCASQMMWDPPPDACCIEGKACFFVFSGPG